MANTLVSGKIDELVTLSSAVTATVSGTSYSTVQGSTGNEVIKGTSGSNFNRYEGSDGADTFYVYESVSSASDANTIGGPYGNTISGGAGNDTIFLGPQVKANFTTTVPSGDRYQNMRSYGTVIEYSNDDGSDVIYDSSGYAEYTIKLTAGKFASTAKSGDDILVTVTASAASTTNSAPVLTLKGAADAELSFTSSGDLFVSRGHNSNALGGKVTLTGGYNDDNKVIIAAANEEGTAATIFNRGENVSIGSAGKLGTFKTVTNYGAKVSITASAASTINSHGAASVIKGSGAADVIKNYNDGNNINALAGNDEIINYQGHKSSLFGGAGNDSISVLEGQAVTVSGDAGNDFIYNTAEKTVIIGGAGNDEISLSSNGSAIVQYSAGMGLDTIYGFGENDTLNLTSGNITNVALGKDTITTITTTTTTNDEGEEVTKSEEKQIEVDNNDLILTVANAKNTITLKDAADKSIKLKVGVFDTIEVNSETVRTTGWVVDEDNKMATYYGTTATATPVVQVTGLGDDVTASNIGDYFKVSGKNLTVLKDGALGTGTASIIGGGSFTIDKSVMVSKTTAGFWTVEKDSPGEATYTAADITEGYVLASNKKSITYQTSPANGGSEVAYLRGLSTKVTAAQLKTALNESTGIITLPKAVLPAASSSVNVVLKNFNGASYKLELAKGVATSSTTDEGWTMSGTTASYKTSGTTGAYEVSSNGLSVTYNTTTTKPTTIATLTGLKKGTYASQVFVNNNVITLTKDMLGTTNLALTTTPGTTTESWQLALDRGEDNADIPIPTVETQGYWKTATVSKKIDNVKTDVSTTATFYTPKITKTGMGYTLSDDGKNVTYYANNSGNKASLILQGLAVGLDTTAANAEDQGTLTGVDYDTKNSIVTISDEAINDNNETYGVGGIKIAGTVNPGTKFIIDSSNDVQLTNSTKFAVQIEGNAGNDILAGGAGADTIYGGKGDDYVNGNAGDDVLYSGDGEAETVLGGAGNDTLYGQNTGEVFVSSEAVTKGKTTTTVYTSSVILDGGAGNDVIYSSGAGGASLSGGAGNDTLYGGKGNDTLDAGAGNDVVSVGSGVALADGGAGNDTLYGGEGKNTLDAGAGNDSIIGGSGSCQTLLGNAGNDTIYAKNTELAVDESGDIVIDEEGYASVVLDGGAGNDVMYAGTGGGMLFGDAGNDKLIAAESVADSVSTSLYGGAGNDTLTGSDGNDFLYGYIEYNSKDQAAIKKADDADAYNAYVAYKKDGADVINGGAGNDMIDGGFGNDKLYGDEGDDRIYGKEGNDTIEGGDGDDILYGDDEEDTLTGSGNDVLYAGKGTDKVYGGSGNDKLYGGEGTSELYGGLGNDTLYAESAGGVLDGGNGVDHLYSGTAAVEMTGGDGADTFYCATTASDVITDYSGRTVYDSTEKKTVTGDKDKIKLTNLAFKNEAEFNALVTSYEISGNNVVLNFNGKTLTIQNAVGNEITFVSSSNKTVYKTYKAATSDSLFAEDNFITADSLDQIVETSTVGDFDLTTSNDKLQAENLITYSDK